MGDTVQGRCELLKRCAAGNDPKETRQAIIDAVAGWGQAHSSEYAAVVEILTRNAASPSWLPLELQRAGAGISQDSSETGEGGSTSTSRTGRPTSIRDDVTRYLWFRFTRREEYKSQADFAKKLDISPSTVSKSFERVRKHFDGKEPTQEQLERFLESG